MCVRVQCTWTHTCIAVEQLQTFVQHNASTSSLNMKCKLVNSKKTQKFCRFLRLNDDVGFHLEEGRGDERYRYFGNGFKNLECGISIANPDENDKSPWKCFIGVDDENGEMKTIGGIVDGTDPKQTQSQGYLFFSFKFLVFHLLCIFFLFLCGL